MISIRRARATRDGGAAASGASAVFGRGQRCMLFAGFVLLVALRLPRAWKHGRFLDEEATVFLAYAWHRPWLDALFRPFAGYWNLGADATTLLVARLVQYGVVPLERAPYLTMTMALAVQALPAALILTGRAHWLTGRAAVIAALLVVAIAPTTEEVFFNVLHMQFHLALCTALILALDVPHRRRARIAYGAMLLAAPLFGPGAIVLLPLFALRAIVDRDGGRLEQLAAAAAGAAIQLLLFYGNSPTRGHLMDPGTVLAAMLVRLIALPALGFERAQRIGMEIYAAQLAGGWNGWWPLALALALFGALLVLAARRRDAALWLVLSSLTIAVTSYGYGMIVPNRIDLFSVIAGERYNFLPMVLLGLTLIALAMRPGSRARPIFALACLSMIVTGAVRYRDPWPDMRDGPSWPAEVAAWRRDHRHPLAIWPRPYTADLSDGDPPCVPIGREPASSTQPRYCESGYFAGFLRMRRGGH